MYCGTVFQLDFRRVVTWVLKRYADEVEELSAVPSAAVIRS
jgi:hypothetical protein